MSIPPLTQRQERLLRFIETSLAKRGYVPSLQEMADASDIGGGGWHVPGDWEGALNGLGWDKRFRACLDRDIMFIDCGYRQAMSNSSCLSRTEKT